jgi:hypothetical protein
MVLDVGWILSLSLDAIIVTLTVIYVISTVANKSDKKQKTVDQSLNNL